MRLTMLKGFGGVLPLALMLVCFLAAPAFPYGGGGGGGGDRDFFGSDDPGAAPPEGGGFESMTAEELAEMLNGLSPEWGNESVDPTAVAGGTIEIPSGPLTPEDIRRMRQEMLESEQFSADMEKKMWEFLTAAAEVLDKTGQISQTGLSYVPGVGWTVAAGLDAARAGAESYKKGDSAAEIMRNTLIAGTTSVVVNKLSPLKSDDSYNAAKRAFNLAKNTGNKVTKTAAIKHTGSFATKYITKKEIENRTGQALGSTLDNMTKSAENTAPAATNSNAPGGSPAPGPLGTDLGSAPQSGISGGTVQIN